MKINEILQQALGATADDNKVLYDYYVNELTSVLEAKNTLEQLERDIRLKIAKYSNSTPKIDDVVNSVVVNIKTDGYPLKGTWTDKIEFLLQSNDSLTGKEIVTIVEEIQPELKGKITSSIYPTLSDNSKPGKKFVKFFDEKLKVNKFRLNK